MWEPFRAFVSFQLNEPLKQIGGLVAGSHGRREQPGSTGAALKIWKNCSRRKDPASSAEFLGLIPPGQALCSSRWSELDGEKEENAEYWRERVKMAGCAVGALRSPRVGAGGLSPETLCAWAGVGVGVFS